MVKLPVESCDPLRAMEAARHASADAVGPTARWKAFVFDLDWRRSLAQLGGGYGGTQALPIICYTVAEARLNGLDLPIYAGGGLFDRRAAAKSGFRKVISGYSPGAPQRQIGVTAPAILLAETLRTGFVDRLHRPSHALSWPSLSRGIKVRNPN